MPVKRLWPGAKVGWVQGTRWCLCGHTDEFPSSPGGCRLTAARSWDAESGLVFQWLWRHSRVRGKGTCLSRGLTGWLASVDTDFSWGCHCCMGTPFGQGHWFQRLLCIFGQVSEESCLTAFKPAQDALCLDKKIYPVISAVFTVIDTGYSELREISLYHI